MRRAADELRIDRREAAIELRVAGRHRAIEHVREIEQHMLAFLLDARPHGGIFGGLPGARDVHADLFEARVLLLRRASGIQPLDQRAHDPRLLFEHRLARRLGRMRREHRFEQQPPEPRAQCLGIDAGGVQARQAIHQSARLRTAVGGLVLAPTADAVHLLGQIDELEITRKRTHQIERALDRQIAQERGQIAQALRFAFAPRDRTAAHFLQQLEEARPELIRQHLPDEPSEQAHVLAQGLILRLENHRSRHVPARMRKVRKSVAHSCCAAARIGAGTECIRLRGEVRSPRWSRGSLRAVRGFSSRCQTR